MSSGIAPETSLASNWPDRYSDLRTLSDAFRTRPASVWLAELESADVPVSPVNGVDEVFVNPQVQHRGLRVTVEHPVSGTVDLLRNPIRMSETPIVAYGSPPTLGQHSHEILGKVLGRTPEEIRYLEQAGVV